MPSQDHSPNDAQPRADRPHDSKQARTYEQLLRTARAEWSALEQAGDPSVSVSASALETIKTAVRAEVRHGSQVHVPPTEHGPWTLSDLALRTLIRHAIDAVPDARALRTIVDHDDLPTPSAPGAGRGAPRYVTCRVSVSSQARSLPDVARDIRSAVRNALRDELGVDVERIDIHIEDLHDD